MHTKYKVLNVLMVVTSLLGYLEWGKDRHTFLFEAEMEVFQKLFSDPLSVLHPFVVLPLLGQLLLLSTLFSGSVSRVRTFTGMGCIGILLLMMLLVGVLGANWKIMVSTLPFLATAVWTIWARRQAESVSKSG